MDIIDVLYSQLALIYETHVLYVELHKEIFWTTLYTFFI